MSEYQYYEFLAIDQPLSADEQAAVRSLSTRARINSTSFVNEYHWGDFKGDPCRLMERYYDAHLHVANWGTHRPMFRLPCALLGPEVVEEYCIDDQVKSWVSGEFVVLDLSSEDDAGEFDFDYGPRRCCPGSSGSVSSSLPVISDLSTSRAWPPTAGGSATKMPSTTTPMTMSNRQFHQGWALSRPHNGRWPTFYAWTTTSSRSRRGLLRRWRKPRTIPMTSPPG
jgi:hypothetical protein